MKLEDLPTPSREAQQHMEHHVQYREAFIQEYGVDEWYAHVERRREEKMRKYKQQAERGH